MATALADPDGARSSCSRRAPGRNPRFNGELIHPHGVDVLDERGFLGPLHEAGGADVRGFAVVQSADRADDAPALRRDPGLAPVRLRHRSPRSRRHAAQEDARAARHRAAPRRARRRRRARSGARRRRDDRQGARCWRRWCWPATGATRRSARSSRCPSARRLLSFTAAALLEDCPLPQPGYGHIFLGAWGPILVYPISGTQRAHLHRPAADMDKGKEAVVARHPRRTTRRTCPPACARR